MNKVLFGLAAVIIFSTIVAISFASFAKSAELEAGHNAVSLAKLQEDSSRRFYTLV